MLRKLINYFGGGPVLLPPFRRQLHAAGAVYLGPGESVRTYSTTFEVRRATRTMEAPDAPLADHAQNQQDEPQSGFVRREPIFCHAALRPIGHEIMLNNSSELLGSKVSPMLRRMHDELLLKSILAQDKLQLSRDDLVFITLSPDSLEHEAVMRLPAHNTVLAFRPDGESADRLIARCRQLRARGFRFAVDNFTCSAEFLPLLGLIDYLRFNAAGKTIPELEAQLQLIPRAAEKTLIAKYLHAPETLEETASCRLFQHYQGAGFDAPPARSGNRILE